MGKSMTAADVRRAVYRHFAGRWAVVFEVTARPEPLDEAVLAAYRRGEMSYTDLRAAQPHDRRIDALLVRRTPRPRRSMAQQVAEWREREARRRGEPLPEQPSGLFEVPAEPVADAEPGDDGGLERLALEIKVTRGDFWQDVRNPDKQAPWRELAERHAYVAPAGMIQPAELPAGSGLLEIGASGQVRWKRNAPRAHTAKPLPIANVLDAFHRWSRAEARVQGLSHGAERDGDAEQMRAELHRLRHEVELLTGQAERARSAAEVWRKRYAAVGAPECGTCGKPIRPARKGRTDTFSCLHWEHAPADERACYELRHKAAFDADMAKPPERRIGGSYLHVPDPEPRYPWDDEDIDMGCAVPG